MQSRRTLTGLQAHIHMHTWMLTSSPSGSDCHRVNRCCPDCGCQATEEFIAVAVAFVVLLRYARCADLLCNGKVDLGSSLYHLFPMQWYIMSLQLVLQSQVAKAPGKVLGPRTLSAMPHTAHAAPSTQPCSKHGWVLQRALGVRCSDFGLGTLAAGSGAHGSDRERVWLHTHHLSIRTHDRKPPSRHCLVPEVRVRHTISSDCAHPGTTVQPKHAAQSKAVWAKTQSRRLKHAAFPGKKLTVLLLHGWDL